MRKYDPLSAYLRGRPGNRATLSFSDVEAVLGQPLPASAYRHRAWWANESKGAHVEAWAWLDAGWKVEDVNLTAQRVTFGRAV
jgi:hypothetical protein